MSYCICKINCILGLVIKIDDMAFLDSKNAFWAVRYVNPTAFFISKNRQKVVFKKQPFFEKIFFYKFWKGVKILKENVIKVLKVKPHKHPEEKYIGSNAESGGRIY